MRRRWDDRGRSRTVARGIIETALNKLNELKAKFEDSTVSGCFHFSMGVPAVVSVGGVVAAASDIMSVGWAC